MADDDHLDAGERADGNRVEMVLNRDQRRLVAAMAHHVGEKVGRVGAGDDGVGLVDDKGSVQFADKVLKGHGGLEGCEVRRW